MATSSAQCTDVVILKRYVGSIKGMRTIFTTPKMALVKAALISGLLVAIAPAAGQSEPIEKKGTTPYVTHFIFRPLMSH